MLRFLRRRWSWILLAVLLISAVAFLAWALIIPSPMPQALEALQSNARVSVQTGRLLVFRPVDRAPDAGLVLYPGGRVDYRAYAPAAQAIAAQGYLVAIPAMPLNLAVLAPSRAGDVIGIFSDVTHWAVGGHSLGGAMAASYARKHEGMLRGLVLWAAYPSSSDDLSGSALQVVSIYGTRDGLTTGAKIEASRSLLPPSTRWVAIEGGNHAQFAWYGAQSGDQQASISHEEQQAQIVAATVELLRSLTR